MEQFLRSVPADGGMAFVVVQHQEPEMLWGMAMVVFADVPAIHQPAATNLPNLLPTAS